MKIGNEEGKRNFAGIGNIGQKRYLWKRETQGIYGISVKQGSKEDKGIFGNQGKYWNIGKIYMTG